MSSDLSVDNRPAFVEPSTSTPSVQTRPAVQSTPRESSSPTQFSGLKSRTRANSSADRDDYDAGLSVTPELMSWIQWANPEPLQERGTSESESAAPTPTPPQPRNSTLVMPPRNGEPSRTSVPPSSTPAPVLQPTANAANRTDQADQPDEPVPPAQPAPAADVLADPAVLARANTHIGHMNGLDGQVKRRWKRWMPSVDLHPRKPDSAQYHYAKGLTAPERTALTARLEQIIRANGAPELGVTQAQAVQMWLSVQHARLRTHTPAQRSEHRSDQVWRMVGTGAATVAWPLLAGLGGMISVVEEAESVAGSMMQGPISPINGMRQEHKDYYRDPRRPEYAPAFDAFMRALADDQIPDDVKQTILTELLERHIRTEKTIAPVNVNRIVREMNGPALRWGRTTRRLPDPARITAEARQAVIALAAGGYRYDPTEGVPVRRAAAARITAEEVEALYGELPTVKASKVDFESGTTDSALLYETLSYEDRPVVLRTEPDKDEFTDGVYSYTELKNWLARKPTHPMTRAKLTLENIPEYVVRVVADNAEASSSSRPVQSSAQPSSSKSPDQIDELQS